MHISEVRAILKSYGARLISSPGNDETCIAHVMNARLQQVLVCGMRVCIAIPERGSTTVCTSRLTTFPSCEQFN